MRRSNGIPSVLISISKYNFKERSKISKDQKTPEKMYFVGLGFRV
jgi:hypothetical protein